MTKLFGPLLAFTKSRVRALRRDIYLSVARFPFVKAPMDRSIAKYRAIRQRRFLSKYEAKIASSAIEKFNDLQAARIVLTLAELLRFHRDKMTNLVDDFPPLATVESCLAQAGITDDRVVTELHQLVDSEPKFAEAWLELGFAYSDRGNLAMAEGCFGKCLSAPLAIKAAPDRTGCHVQASLGKARALEAQGKLPAAAEAYAIGLAANGTSGIARVAYGKLLRRLGRARQALVEFEAGMQSDVTAVALPAMSRDFSALSERLKARFNSAPNSSLQNATRHNSLDLDVGLKASIEGATRDSASLRNRMRLRLITVVWGESFTDIFLRITARSLLAAGNLEALAQQYEVSYSIHTTEADARTLRSSPIFKRMRDAAEIEIVVFDPQVIDVKNPSSHWVLWRLAAEQARRNKEIVFFIIPDMLFATGTLMRWGALFDQGYRAICMASPQVVLETTMAEIEEHFSSDEASISLTTEDIQDVLLRQLHPLMIAMYRDTTRPSRHSDSLLCEAKDAGLVMRVLASQPFCIDLNYFEMNNAFCPLNHLEDIAYEQPCTVCLEPMLKYPDLYFRTSPRSEDRLSNMGSWIDYHLGPSDILWAAQNSRFVAPGRSDERSFRRAETSLDFFVCQMRLTGTIYRVMQALREAGCKTASQLIAMAHFAGRLRRHWHLKGEVTILVPAGDGDMGLPPGELERLIAPGNEKLLRRAIFGHVFPGRLTFAIGDGLAAGAKVARKNYAGVGQRSSSGSSVAEVIAGPIEVDDCTIYVVDRPLTTLTPEKSLQSKPLSQLKGSILPNRWAMNPRRIMTACPAPNDVITTAPEPSSEPPTLLATFDSFVTRYFDEASTEDAAKAGGLNGHLTVARLLGFEPPLSEGLAAVLVSLGALYHRLHYFKEITDGYCDAIGLSPTEMPIRSLLDSITKKRPPLHRASDLYEAALLVDPGDAKAMFGLAGVRTLAGANDAANFLYSNAAKIDPSLEGHVALRRAAISEAAGNWSGAADLYLEAASRLEVLGEWHENAARCLRLCGRFTEALEHYYLSLNWYRRAGMEFLVSPPSPRETGVSVYAVDPSAPPGGDTSLRVQRRKS